MAETEMRLPFATMLPAPPRAVAELEEQLSQCHKTTLALFALEETLPLKDGSDLAEARHMIYRARCEVNTVCSRLAGRIRRLKEPKQ